MWICELLSHDEAAAEDRVRLIEVDWEGKTHLKSMARIAEKVAAPYLPCPGKPHGKRQTIAMRRLNSVPGVEFAGCL